MMELLLHPLIVGVALLGALVVVLARRWGAGGRLPLLLAATVLALLYGASSRPLSASLLELLERGQRPHVVAPGAAPDAILVLGAGFRDRDTPRPVLTDAAKERSLEAVRLARAYPGAALAFSGGVRAPGQLSSARAMGELARLAGIDGDRIVLEERAMTTRGNAVHLAALARERGWRRTLVVTSARHMPRARAALRAAGLEPQEAPCDFTGAGPALPGWLLPSSRALSDTESFLHEIAGRVWYRLRGWA